MSVTELAAVLGAIVAAFAAIPALYQWEALRVRTKIKNDLELLQMLRQAVKTQEAEGKEGEHPLAGECLKITHHLHKKMEEQYRYRVGEARTDKDWSSIFIGLVMLAAAWVLLRTTDMVVYESDIKALQQGKRVVVHHNWMPELMVLVVIVILGALWMMRKGFRLDQQPMKQAAKAAA